MTSQSGGFGVSLLRKRGLPHRPPQPVGTRVEPLGPDNRVDTGTGKLSILFTWYANPNPNPNPNSNRWIVVPSDIVSLAPTIFSKSYQVNKVLNFPVPVSTRLPGLSGSVLVPTTSTARVIWSLKCTWSAKMNGEEIHSLRFAFSVLPHLRSRNF